MDILILVLAFVVILLGAELFTNGIEWFGRKLDLAEGAVGSVLAAVGTALPETMIPIIAILFASGASSHEVGVGAILGAPFMLSTLAMFVTGIAVLWAGGRRPSGDRMLVDTGVLAHDMRYFAIAYAIAVGAAFLPVDPVWLKWIVAVVLVGIYAWYVRGHLREEATNTGEDLAPLRFHRLDRGAHREDPHTPRLRIVNIQVITALGLIVVGAAFFVGAVSDLSTQLGVDRRCWRWSSPRSRPSCPRSSTRSSGSARARTRWRWATSPARWSSSRRSRRSSRWCSRPTPGSRPRARTSSSRRPASPSCRRPSSSSRWPVAACSTAGCCWPAAPSTSPISCSSSGSSAALIGGGSGGH